MVGTVRYAAAVVGLGLAVLLGACGGGGGSSGGGKAGWEEDNGELVAAYSRDLDDAINNINQGARANTVGSCTQVDDDAKELDTQAFPVPDGTVDAALRRAVDAGKLAAASCIAGARGGGASDIEKSQAEFAEARKALDEAQAAIAAWS
ncbi:MAG: hypothetical protein ACRD12_08925 [Acidimicrobiales bacterium]